MGTAVIDAESLIVCNSINNTPAAGSAEQLKSFRSTVNPRIRDLADNTRITLSNSSTDGAEIMWDYDWFHGVAVHYGGCGNSASPYWSHYGNNLCLFAPGEEQAYIRRLGETGGAKRPGTGCTRSTIYDSNRKIWWLFGGTSSGPYCPAHTSIAGTSVWTYDMDRDLISPVKKAACPGARRRQGVRQERYPGGMSPTVRSPPPGRR